MKYRIFGKCKEEALKHTTKKEFSLKSPSAYVISYRNNWMAELSTYVVSLENKYHRCT